MKVEFSNAAVGRIARSLDRKSALSGRNQKTTAKIANSTIASAGLAHNDDIPDSQHAQSADVFEGHIDFYGYYGLAGGVFFCGWIPDPGPLRDRPQEVIARFVGVDVSRGLLQAFYWREDLRGAGIGFVASFLEHFVDPGAEFILLEIGFSKTSYKVYPSKDTLRLHDRELAERLNRILTRGEENSHPRKLRAPLSPGDAEQPKSATVPNGVIDYGRLFCGVNGQSRADRLSADYDVLMGYQLFFGRSPESSFAIQARKNLPLREIIPDFLTSPECDLIAKPFARAGQSSEFEICDNLTAEQISWIAELLALPQEQDEALRGITSRKELFGVLRWIGSGRAFVPRPTPIGPTGRTKPSGQRAFVLVHVDFPKRGEPLRPGNTVNGKGWVVAEAEIQEITVYLDEIFICFASYGLPRPEVAEKFPHYPQAEQSGFSFSAKLGGNGVGPGHRTIVVKVHTADGAVTRETIPLSIGADAQAAAAELGAGAPPISIFVDHARIDDLGLLSVRGWIASLNPLVDVRLFLGDERLGAPELGRPRPDVAVNHPNYPNAPSSGFDLVQDVSVLPSGRCVLRIVAICAGGIRRQLITPIESSASQRSVSVQDSEIEVCLDSFSMGSDGFVSVEGWAVARAGIQAVDVTLNGQPIGGAEIGLSRPDVGNRFPRISSARQSGFKFVRRSEQELHGEHLLAVTVRTCEGSEKDVQLPLQVTRAAGGQLRVDDLLDNADHIRFEIDSPRLKGDRAAEPIVGGGAVSGWAVARDGLDRIDVQLDEGSPVTAYVGLRREDVAAKYPEYAEALFSGFVVTFPQRVLGEGEHTVRVLIRAKSGQSVERVFQLVSEKPEAPSVGLIRSRVPQAEIDLRNAMLRQMAHRPLYLVLVRAHGLSSPDVQQIRATLETLHRQAYPDWFAVVLLPRGCGELRAAAVIDAEDKTLLERVRLQGRRLQKRLTWPDAPGPAFLVVLSAGDRLGADALLELSIATGLDNSTDFIYGDERCYDPAVEAVRPRLKPDWSPDMLLSTNYIGRVWCAARPLVESAGITAKELAVHGEYDAVLRLTEQARSIGHVPLVICEQAAPSLDTSDAERLALERAITRRGLQGEVLPGHTAGSWRVRRTVETAGLVSIIVPTCGARGLIETLIGTIRERTAYPNFEIFCIDNIPEEEQDRKTWLRQNADQVVEISETFNWSRFNNLGAAASRGEFLLFLNDDIEMRDPGWLHALLEHAQRPEVGVVGPQLLYPDGQVQHAGMFLSGGVGRHAFRYAPADEPGAFGGALVQREMIAVTGACMLMRRSTFEALGGFDEAHDVINNDVDFCLRSWASGLRVVYTPFASLVHYELASRGKLGDLFDEDHFYRTWGRRLAKGDPFFNPGFTPEFDDYTPDPEPVETIYAGYPLMARARVRRIVAVKLDHIGDFVTALPVFHRLKKCFPDSELTVLAAKASLSVAALEPAIDRCIEFNFFNARSELGQRKLDEAELQELQEKLKSYSFDLAIDLRMHPDTRPMLRYTGAELLVGFDHGGQFPWLDVSVEWEGDIRLLPKRVHVTDKLMRLVDAVDIACESERHVLPAVPVAEAWARLLTLPVAQDAPAGFFDKPLVCVHPGVGNVMRQWPIESYTALIDLIVAEEDVHVLIIGGADEAPLAREIEAVVDPAAVLSLVGRIGLADLPLVLQASALFIGNNSGPKHIAAALGVPTVGVHSGNVDAAEWGPLGPHAATVRRKMLCSPCYLSNPAECHRQLACLTGIRPADVYRACRPLLRLRSPPPTELKKESSVHPATKGNRSQRGRRSTDLSLVSQTG